MLTPVGIGCATWLANLARNDIMESLEDLGADTLYQSGEPIDPRTEMEGQPTCRPITGWRFTFGAGILSRAVTGPWGALSIVTDPDGAVVGASSPEAALRNNVDVARIAAVQPPPAGACPSWVRPIARASC